MYKGVAVLGERDSVYGFSAMGLSAFSVEDVDDAKTKFRQLCRGDYAIIYVTEGIAQNINEEIEKTKDLIYPAVILIPGTFGNTGKGKLNVHKTVEKAVGSDILFDKQQKSKRM